MDLIKLGKEKELKWNPELSLQNSDRHIQN